VYDGDDDEVAGFNSGFIHSGWTEVLPQQATAVHALVALATVRDHDGSLDALVALVGTGWFDDATGGLDCPVRWLHPDDIGDPEGDADGARVRDECRTAFAKTGLTVPTTVRDLAHTMADLGVLACDPSVPRWRLASMLLLPAEVLAISDDLRHAQDMRRWSALHERTALYLSRFLAAAGARHSPLRTSVSRLEAAIGHNDDCIRAALELLVRYRALVVRHADGSDADPERLLTHTSVVVSELEFEEQPPAVDDPTA